MLDTVTLINVLIIVPKIDFLNPKTIPKLPLKNKKKRTNSEKNKTDLPKIMKSSFKNTFLSKKNINKG